MAMDSGGTPLSPEVRHTGKPPTGYEVTFRYRDPAASRVQIKGDWYFADPTRLPPRSTFTETIVTPAILPNEWKPGFFPIQSPNTNAPGFPVSDMVKGDDGVWTFTTPLPSGVFGYGFYIDCPGQKQTGCTSAFDPANPPWNRSGGSTAGTTPRSSQVYVPSDKSFGTIDYEWQARNDVPHGQLSIVSYRSPLSTNPQGDSRLVVYTPPGYDPRRPALYATLYLAHGSGGNEMEWSTQGVAGNILDNLIATGEIRPMVVVMPSDVGLPGRQPDGGYDQGPYSQNLIETVIPYVESHYNVSRSASDRAFAGLSQGSGVANYLLINRTEQFAYYGSFSRGPSYLVPAASALTPRQIAALRQVQGIFVGAGWDERGYPYSTFMVGMLMSIGAAVTPEFIHGGHEWYVWRIFLHDFLIRVAFLPPVNAECPQCVGPYPPAPTTPNR
jgi:enterochelin esterase-like enzyme